ncbi:AAA family ATPase [Phaeodactylibacter luteus]|uniref:NadR/Ttd14 AAA domain-containing protein n=1 Tax=Phaeodactylibacter luteus TaxID=1564516 RepID=A0A5C6RH70_9BACT|nr:AAA family ATPase [Phaeodactylibacter luteus]TXB61424.1 hypothetical protein FRY97_19215 [Phaeodactylibacter luteus]
MKTIVITGLDGTGKSTVLQALKAQAPGAARAIVHAPEMDLEPLHKQPDVFRAARLVNQLNHDADRLAFPQLKAVALFAAMLLFEKLLQPVRERQGPAALCERHPLIDTSVYAQFYANKLSPDAVSARNTEPLERGNEAEWAYLLSLLPQDWAAPQNEGPVRVFMRFIYDRFHLQQRHQLSGLIGLFKLPLPDKVFFLQAPAKVLFARLQQRGVLEAHESLAALSMLEKAYQQHLQAFEAAAPGRLEIIDATSQTAMAALLPKLAAFL